MTQFFANILTGINSLIGNYGWSMVLFTVLIKLLISPLDYKSRTGMRRTQAIQPQIAKLQNILRLNSCNQLSFIDIENLHNTKLA